MECVSGDSDELVQAMATVLRAVSGGSAPAAPTRKLLRVDEVADQLAVSTSSVYRLIQSGEIRSVKLGSCAGSHRPRSTGS